MNLAYKYPIIFWNTACLITDAGGNESEDIEQQLNKDEIIYDDEEDFDEEIEDEEDEEDCECIDSSDRETKTKKKIAKTTNYGKNL